MLLRVLRFRAGLEQSSAAERLGVSQPTVSRWERGTHALDAARLEELLALYTAPETTGELLRGLFSDDPRRGDAAAGQLEDELYKLLRAVPRLIEASIPYYADVAAGVGESQEERAAPRQELEVPRALIETDPGCYALRVVGDSMAPLFLAGDLVVVSPAATLVPGCIVAAFIEPDGDVIKRYRPSRNGAVELEPENPEYPVLMLGGDEGREGRIWGRVVMLRRDL
jgi:repressor LexA